MFVLFVAQEFNYHTFTIGHYCDFCGDINSDHRARSCQTRMYIPQKDCPPVTHPVITPEPPPVTPLTPFTLPEESMESPTGDQNGGGSPSRLSNLLTINVQFGTSLKKFQFTSDESIEGLKNKIKQKFEMEPNRLVLLKDEQGNELDFIEEVFKVGQLAVELLREVQVGFRQRVERITMTPDTSFASLLRRAQESLETGDKKVVLQYNNGIPVAELDLHAIRHNEKLTLSALRQVRLYLLQPDHESGSGTTATATANAASVTNTLDIPMNCTMDAFEKGIKRTFGVDQVFLRM